jgi:hypothetical protein
MSEGESTIQPQDIDLDASGAESVVGGAGTYQSSSAGISKSHMTMSQAIKAGYRPITGEHDGVTLMKNAKTGREILVR